LRLVTTLEVIDTFRVSNILSLSPFPAPLAVVEVSHIASFMSSRLGLAAGTPSLTNSSTNYLELLTVLFLTTFPALARLASGGASDESDTGLRFFS
ncbi:hypothetical protein Tco_0119230, partial [Tanacetum coccineum]